MFLRLIKFSMVGVIGLGVDYAALVFAQKFLGLGLYAGGLFSYLVAASFTWAGNRLFTFRDRPKNRAEKEWLLFLAVNTVGMLVNRGVYMGLIAAVPLIYANPFFALAAGSLCGLAFNYTLSSRFVFRKA